MAIPRAVFVVRHVRVSVLVAVLVCLCTAPALSALNVTFFTENRSASWMPRNLVGCALTPNATSIRFLAGITTDRRPAISVSSTTRGAAPTAECRGRSCSR